MKPGQPPSRRGGARPGAGRPRKGEQHKSIAVLVTEQIDQTLVGIRQVGITEALVREMAMQGLATLYHAARRGNIKASMYLVDRLMGSPDQPFQRQLEEMEPDEVRAQLIEQLRDGGFSFEVAVQIVDVLAAAETPALPAECPIPDLPIVEAEYREVRRVEKDSGIGSIRPEDPEAEDEEYQTYLDDQDDRTVEP